MEKSLLEGFSKKAKQAAAGLPFQGVWEEWNGEVTLTVRVTSGGLVLTPRGTEACLTVGTFCEMFGFEEAERKEVATGREVVVDQTWWGRNVMGTEKMRAIVVRRNGMQVSFWILDPSLSANYVFRVVVENGEEGFGLYVRPKEVRVWQGTRGINLSPDDPLVRQRMEEVGVGLPLDKNLLPLHRIQWGRDVMVVLPEELIEIKRKGVVVLDDVPSPTGRPPSEDVRPVTFGALSNIRRRGLAS